MWVGCGCDMPIVSVCKRSGNYFNLFSTSVCYISGMSGNSAESHVKTWVKWRRAPSFSSVTNSLTMSELLFKVIIIGDATVGKTSFVQRYVHSHPRREYKPTVGGEDMCLHFPTNCQTCEVIRILNLTLRLKLIICSSINPRNISKFQWSLWVRSSTTSWQQKKDFFNM